MYLFMHVLPGTYIIKIYWPVDETHDGEQESVHSLIYSDRCTET